MCKRLEVLNGSAADQRKPAEDWLASCEIAVEATRLPVGTVATYLRGDAQPWGLQLAKLLWKQCYICCNQK